MNMNSQILKMISKCCWIDYNLSVVHVILKLETNQKFPKSDITVHKLFLWTIFMDIKIYLVQIISNVTEMTKKTTPE